MIHHFHYFIIFYFFIKFSPKQISYFTEWVERAILQTAQLRHEAAQWVIQQCPGPRGCGCGAEHLCPPADKQLELYLPHILQDAGSVLWAGSAHSPNQLGTHQQWNQTFLKKNIVIILLLRVSCANLGSFRIACSGFSALGQRFSPLINLLIRACYFSAPKPVQVSLREWLSAVVSLWSEREEKQSRAIRTWHSLFT